MYGVSSTPNKWYLQAYGGFAYIIDKIEISDFFIGNKPYNYNLTLSVIAAGIGREWFWGINDGYGLAFELGYMYAEGSYTYDYQEYTYQYNWMT